MSHWIDPERIFDSVVVMSDDAVYVCNPTEERAREITASLESGEPANIVMKEDPTTILIGGISVVRYDQNDVDIDIGFKLGKEDGTKNIAFSTREERDDFAAQLTEHLTDFDGQTVQWGPIRASLGPLTFGGIAGGFTWLLHAAAQAMAAGAEAEASGRRAGLKKLIMGAIEFIGPTGVLVAGGLVLALTGMVLVKRIKSPPLMTTLKARK